MCSIDFVFDRAAEGRNINNLRVVDEATHKAVAIVPGRALSGNQLERILEQLAGTRGFLKAIRSTRTPTSNHLANGPEMWAAVGLVDTDLSF